ncbi:microProtein 1a, B-box domain protein 31 [Hibiscus trionum]|uniref:MicroProtein 1a, B-box domain protein 31 n=1 Tax=Hibiscus trionum TaxID=183268 RepID=A0A9W7HCI3_HIBTR|nr:microProtein 1a, B-box domain protein 31 [Hibiscus trionum]
MCRGLQEAGNTSSSCLKQGFPVVSETGFTRSCELCNSRASLYCQADDAYLCRKCDKWVHQANFLALRHIRCFLCNTCQSLTQRYLIGASQQVVLPTMVSSPGRTQCDSDMETKHSTTLKTPFLFL